MFPLVHYLVNQKIFGHVPSLMALGALYPDLAQGVGIGRDYAHSMGSAFHAWCQTNASSGIPLAQGIISHGSDPKGVDYYADEYWPGYQKGWCFMLGERYMDQVADVTKLPADLIWWKAHNFVEISYELITNNEHPYLKDELLAAINNRTAVDDAARILSAYHQISKQKIIDVFAMVPHIFALEKITARSLANKQNLAFICHHKISTADPEAMAELFLAMSRDLQPGFYPFIEEITSKTALVLSSY